MSVDFNYSDFIDHGELALYSAALLTPAIYLVAKDPREARFPCRLFFLLVPVTLLIFSSITFSGVLATTIDPSQTPHLNKDFLIKFSGSLFIFSAMTVYFIWVLNNVRLAEDLNTLRKKQRKQLLDDFDKTE
jgi:hypothetical protein